MQPNPDNYSVPSSGRRFWGTYYVPGTKPALRSRKDLTQPGLWWHQFPPIRDIKVEEEPVVASMAVSPWALERTQESWGGDIPTEMRVSCSGQMPARKCQGQRAVLAFLSSALASRGPARR